MKKENRMDDKAKSPDPDDLTRDKPKRPMTPDEMQKFEKEVIHGEDKPNPDASAPHVPPPD